MYDTRTVMHGQRFFITNNDIDPKIYQVTKIVDTNPQGVIKLSIKQDDFDEKRDNSKLRICDYYKLTGDTNVEVVIPEVIEDPDENEDPEISENIKSSTISWMMLDENEELELSDGTSDYLQIGVSSYFKAEFFDGEDIITEIIPHWNITLLDANDEEEITPFTEEEKQYYIELLKIKTFDDNTASIKPGKANSLKGKRFVLTVSDRDGNYASSIEMEVV